MWCRGIGSNRLRSLFSNQSIRWLFLPRRTLPPSPPNSFGARPISKSVAAQLTPARGFKTPRENSPEKGPSRPRTNEEIVAEYVRLVSDEGHCIVLRSEALDRARRLDLDLVEVQHGADPPVCKIMDFHKEKSKKQAIIKERAKSKTDTSLRKGDFKEVKFTGKIEKKDLELKAETAKRLMERGYRVKIIAEVGKQGGSSGAGNEDLSGVLSRLYNLIEDISVAESPPLVKDRTAYVIVRHAKFGLKKNPPKKIRDDAKGNDEQRTGPVMHAAKALKPSEFGFKPFNDAQTLVYSHSRPGQEHTELDSSQTGLKNFHDIGKYKAGSAFENGHGPNPPVPSLAKETPPEFGNRYMKSGPGGGSNAARLPMQSSFAKGRNERRPDPMQRYSDSHRFGHSGGGDNTARLPMQSSFAKARDGGQVDPMLQYSDQGHPSRKAPLEPPPERKQNPDNFGRKYMPSSPSNNSPSLNFGIFSTPKGTVADAPPDFKERVEKISSDKGNNQQLKNNPTEREWGIFSR